MNGECPSGKGESAADVVVAVIADKCNSCWPLDEDPPLLAVAAAFAVSVNVAVLVVVASAGSVGSAAADDGEIVVVVADDVVVVVEVVVADDVAAAIEFVSRGAYSTEGRVQKATSIPRDVVVVAVIFV